MSDLDRIIGALRGLADEGETPVLSIVTSTLLAIRATEARWDLPGEPSVKDYAAVVVETMEARYLKREV